MHIGLCISLEIDLDKIIAYIAKAFRDYMKEQNYSEVAICGLDECFCVGATAKGAVKNGVKVVMIENCIGRRFPDANVQRMREGLRALGIKYITEGKDWHAEYFCKVFLDILCIRLHKGIGRAGRY